MSSFFLNIKDPEERDKQMMEYLALKKRLKEQNMKKRGDYMDHRREMEANFAPIIDSTGKSTDAITNELQAIRRNIPIIPVAKTELEPLYSDLAEEFLNRYMDPKGEVDTTFGIRFENGSPMIGRKMIKIKGNDIVVDGDIYHGTPGLWSLITDKHPQHFTETDFTWYKDILHQTSALHQDYIRYNNPRASKSKKWTSILRPIWNEIQVTGWGDNDGEESGSEYSEDSLLDLQYISSNLQHYSMI